MNIWHEGTKGTEIADHASHGAWRGITIHFSDSIGVSILHLGSRGLLGRHPASSHQLLYIVAGDGQVSGEDGRFDGVASGDVVVWLKGEQHETRAGTIGMSALVIEGSGFDPILAGWAPS